MNMEDKIKDKVREIQHKYCGTSVEYKLYKAIEETMKEKNSKPRISLKINSDMFDDIEMQFKPTKKP